MQHFSSVIFEKSKGEILQEGVFTRDTHAGWVYKNDPFKAIKKRALDLIGEAYYHIYLDRLDCKTTGKRRMDLVKKDWGKVKWLLLCMVPIVNFVVFKKYNESDFNAFKASPAGKYSEQLLKAKASDIKGIISKLPSEVEKIQPPKKTGKFNNGLGNLVYGKSDTIKARYIEKAKMIVEDFNENYAKKAK